MYLAHMILLLILLPLSLYGQRYEIGPKWNRQFILDAPAKLRKLSPSVGEIGSSATLFYIGKIKILINHSDLNDFPEIKQ